MEFAGKPENLNYVDATVPYFIPRRDVFALPSGPIDSLLGYCSSERNLSLRFCAGNPPFLNPIFFLIPGWLGWWG